MIASPAVIAIMDAVSCTLCRYFTANGTGYECTQPTMKQRVRLGKIYRYAGYPSCKASLPLGEIPPHFERKEG